MKTKLKTARATTIARRQTSLLNQRAQNRMALAAGDPRDRVRDILVPLDFSRNSEHALDYAVPLARQFGGKITLLHVVDWPVVPSELSTLVINEGRLTGAAKERLDALARAKVPAEFLGKTIVRVGRSYQEICRSAQGLKMDLIVIATHGRTGFKRALLGSTAERVVRHAPCPVLTVRWTAGASEPGLKSLSLRPRINRILVPLDFSEPSKAAVRFAVGLARTMRARLALLHVVAPLPVIFAQNRAEMQEYDAEIKLEARQKLNALAATVPKDIKAEVLLRQDIPPRGINSAAQEWRSDLIVLPTRGLTGVKYIVLGSTAEAVVRHASCSVLTLGVASVKGRASENTFPP